MKKIWSRKDKKVGDGESVDSYESHRGLHRLSSTRSLAAFVRTTDPSRKKGDQAAESETVEPYDDTDLASVVSKNKFYKSSSFSSSSSHIPSSLKRSKASTEKFGSRGDLHSLVQPRWDEDLIKVGWLNRSASSNDENVDNMKLCRAEIRGSFMSLYKPPSELTSVKAFKSAVRSAPEKKPAETSSADNADGQSVADSATLRHEASSESLGGLSSAETTLNPSHQNRSSSTVRSISTTVGSENFVPQLTFFTSKFPHPDVIMDTNTDTILNASLEGLCHSIFFNTYKSEGESEEADDSLTRNLIGILPFFDDLVMAIKYFTAFSDTFIRSKPNDILTLVEDEKQVIICSHEVSTVFTRRLFVVVEYLRDVFSGALLDEAIFKALWDLMLSIDSHENSDDLKKSIHRRQQELLKLCDAPAVDSLDEFSGDYFMGCDPVLLAHSIHAIHSEYKATWSPNQDPTLLLDHRGDKNAYQRRNPLVFSPDKDFHFAGQLLVHHLFNDSVYSKSPKQRALILTRWIEVAIVLDRLGDMVGWLSIATVVCSIPVLRLKHTWSFVEGKILDEVSSNWSPVVSELNRRSVINAVSTRSTYHVIVPQGMGVQYPKETVVPYFGDLIVSREPQITVHQCEKKRRRLNVSFQKWNEYWNTVANQSNLKVDAGNPSEPMLKKLRSIHSYRSQTEPFTLEKAMDLSLLVEPAYSGHFHEFHNTARSPLFLGSYASVIFPSPLDNYQIYDQQALIGAIGGTEGAKKVAVYDNALSNQSNVVKSDENKDNMTNAAGIAGRTQFLKSIRDLFNIGSSDFHVGDDIVFKTMSDSEPLNEQPDNEKENLRSGSTHLRGFDLTDGASKRDSLSTMRSRSRPSSILFTESINTKRFSSYSSSGLNFDDVALSATKNSSGIHSVEILTKAATMERLIDLLVLTSSIFAAEIRKDDVISYLASELASSIVNLRMDNGVYTVTFFATYRGFCSTATLLQGLLKRFVCARSAAYSIAHRSSNKSFSLAEYPRWDYNFDAVEDIVIQRYTSQIQIGVLEVLYILIKDHFEHFTDNLESEKYAAEILKVADQEAVVEWAKALSRTNSRSEDYAEIDKYREKILSLYKKLRRLYIRRSYKPLLPTVKLHEFPEGSSIVPLDALLSDSPSKIKNFISSIDSVIHEVFIQASTTDWLDTFDTLEIQAASSLTGLSQYQMQKLKTPEDQLAISNVFTWISSLVTQRSTHTVKVLDILPHAVKSIIEFYFKLQTYFVLQLCDPNISRNERVKRMRAILLMLAISRSRMVGLDLFDAADAQEIGVSPHVPSLLESVIVNSIICAESRLFVHSWVAAVESLNGSVSTIDSLKDLLPTEIPDSLASGPTLTACPGWLLQRLVEIAYYIPNMSVENTSLINFDKRRFAYNCVSNIVDMVSLRERNSFDDTVDFSFVFGLNPDEHSNKSVTDAATRESKDYLKEGAAKPSRLFGSLIDEQFKILSREHSKKAFLSRQEVEKDRFGRQVNSYRSTRPNRITPVPSTTTLASTLRRKNAPATPTSNKFKISGFGSRAAKLLSFGSVVADQVVSVDDLPDPADFVDSKQKPFMQVCLKNHLSFPVYHIPSSFKITTASPDISYLFQAVDDLDREDWISKGNYSAKHWFHSRTLVANAPSTQVFGVPLEYICIREGTLVPIVLEKLMTEIEVRGLEEVGIYRKSASLTVLNSIKAEIDAHGDLNMENHLVLDIHNAAACIKVFLRELPDPLVSDELVVQFAEARKSLSDMGERCVSYSLILESLPFYNYQFLKRLINHLKKIDEYKEYSKMNASNLATILGATFTEGSGPEITRRYFGVMSFVCEEMINYYDSIFKL